MAADYIFIGADTLITYDEMTDAATGNFLNAATGTWDLKTNASGVPGTSLATGSMTYVTGSDGKYQFTIAYNAPSTALTINTYYWIEVTVTSGSIRDFRRKKFEAVYHGARP